MAMFASVPMRVPSDPMASSAAKDGSYGSPRRLIDSPSGNVQRPARSSDCSFDEQLAIAIGRGPSERFASGHRAWARVRVHARRQYGAELQSEGIGDGLAYRQRE